VKSECEAARFFQRVVDKHNPMGEVNLGFCLHEGIGVDRDRQISTKYFKSAADKGDRIGQFNYGLCCDNGEGVPVDRSVAAQDFKLSADQDYLPAQFAYRKCLCAGCGVLSDFARGTEYQTQAHRFGAGKAIESRGSEIQFKSNLSHPLVRGKQTSTRQFLEAGNNVISISPIIHGNSIH
jgi:TPR repeat protein